MSSVITSCEIASNSSPLLTVGESQTVREAIPLPQNSPQTRHTHPGAKSFFAETPATVAVASLWLPPLPRHPRNSIRDRATVHAVRQESSGGGPLRAASTVPQTIVQKNLVGQCLRPGEAAEGTGLSRFLNSTQSLSGVSTERETPERHQCHARPRTAQREQISKVSYKARVANQHVWKTSLQRTTGHQPVGHQVTLSRPDTPGGPAQFARQQMITDQLAQSQGRLNQQQSAPISGHSGLATCSSVADKGSSRALHQPLWCPQGLLSDASCGSTPAMPPAMPETDSPTKSILTMPDQPGTQVQLSSPSPSCPGLTSRTAEQPQRCPGPICQDKHSGLHTHPQFTLEFVETTRREHLTSNGALQQPSLHETDAAGTCQPEEEGPSIRTELAPLHTVLLGELPGQDTTSHNCSDTAASLSSPCDFSPRTHPVEHTSQLLRYTADTSCFDTEATTAGSRHTHHKPSPPISSHTWIRHALSDESDTSTSISGRASSGDLSSDGTSETIPTNRCTVPLYSGWMCLRHNNQQHSKACKWVFLLWDRLCISRGSDGSGPSKGFSLAKMKAVPTMTGDCCFNLQVGRRLLRFEARCNTDAKEWVDEIGRAWLAYQATRTSHLNSQASSSTRYKANTATRQAAGKAEMQPCRDDHTVTHSDIGEDHMHKLILPSVSQGQPASSRDTSSRAPADSKQSERERPQLASAAPGASINVPHSAEDARSAESLRSAKGADAQASTMSARAPTASNQAETYTQTDNSRCAEGCDAQPKTTLVDPMESPAPEYKATWQSEPRADGDEARVEYRVALHFPSADSITKSETHHIDDHSSSSTTIYVKLHGTAGSGSSHALSAPHGFSRGSTHHFVIREVADLGAIAALSVSAADDTAKNTCRSDGQAVLLGSIALTGPAGNETLFPCANVLDTDFSAREHILAATYSSTEVSPYLSTYSVRDDGQQHLTTDGQKVQPHSTAVPNSLQPQLIASQAQPRAQDSQKNHVAQHICDESLPCRIAAVALEQIGNLTSTLKRPSVHARLMAKLEDRPQSASVACQTPCHSTCQTSPTMLDRCQSATSCSNSISPHSSAGRIGSTAQASRAIADKGADVAQTPVNHMAWMTTPYSFRGTDHLFTENYFPSTDAALAEAEHQWGQGTIRLKTGCQLYGIDHVPSTAQSLPPDIGLDSHAEISSAEQCDQYVITVWTSDIRGAGTSSQPYIQLLGVNGQSCEVALDNGRAGFERGGVDICRGSATAIGSVISISLRLNPTAGDDTSCWQIDKVEVHSAATAETSTFAKSDWRVTTCAGDVVSAAVHSLVMPQDNAAPQPQARTLTADTAKQDSPSQQHCIVEEISPAPIENIGFADQPSMEEPPQQCWIPNSHIEIRIPEPPFADTCSIYSRESSALEATCSETNSWYCSDNFSSGDIDATDNIKSEQRRKTAMQLSSNQCGRHVAIEGQSAEYHVSISTSRKLGLGGTKGKVFVELIGEQGSTGQLWLPAGKAFAAGSVAQFRLTDLPQVGRVLEVRVGVDSNDPRTRRWHLKAVDVLSCIGSSSSPSHVMEFPCNKWIGKACGFERILWAS